MDFNFSLTLSRLNSNFTGFFRFYVLSAVTRLFQALYFSIPSRRFNSPFLHVPEETEKVFLRVHELDELAVVSTSNSKLSGHVEFEMPVRF